MTIHRKQYHMNSLFHCCDACTKYTILTVTALFNNNSNMGTLTNNITQYTSQL